MPSLGATPRVGAFWAEDDSGGTRLDTGKTINFPAPVVTELVALSQKKQFGDATPLGQA